MEPEEAGGTGSGSSEDIRMEACTVPNLIMSLIVKSN